MEGRREQEQGEASSGQEWRVSNSLPNTWMVCLQISMCGGEEIRPWRVSVPGALAALPPGMLPDNPHWFPHYLAEL